MWLKTFVQSMLKRSCATMAAAMERECIAPDVIDAGPKKSMTIYYRGGVEVACGNLLTPTQVKDRPVIIYNGNPECFYTLILTNPDVPCRENPISKEWQHWLVVNIPGGCVNMGETITQYVGAIPGKGVGLQRYVFFVFQQQDKCWFDEPRLCDNTACCRDCFSTRDFACKYSFGKPVFGNFFQAKFDNYVNTINRQLGVEES